MQARTKLVEAFKVLRAGDSVPGSRTVYRITVRQLEALIRLSEALARVYHRTSVLVEDVREAQRLIKASVHSAGDGDMVMDIPQPNEGTEDIARLFLDGDAQPDADMEDQAGVLPPSVTALGCISLYKFDRVLPLSTGTAVWFNMMVSVVGDAEVAVPAEQDENIDENREVGRRVRRRPHGRTAFDDSMAPVAKPVQRVEPAQEKETSQVRLSRTRWTYLHNHVLACLKQAEEGMLEGAQKIESTSDTFMGLSQHDIIKWHVRQELEKYVSPPEPELPQSVQRGDTRRSSRLR